MKKHQDNPFCELLGSYIKTLRRDVLKQGLREFCERNGFDAGNHSKVENGKLGLSPSKAKDYARALKLSKEDKEPFFDLVEVAQGRLPLGIYGRNIFRALQKLENFCEQVRWFYGGV